MGLVVPKALRVTRFQRDSLWSTIDQAIRVAMPDFLEQPGLEAIWFGRRGPASGDERVIVSLWGTAAEEARGLSFPEMLAALGVQVVTPSRIVLPVAFDVSADRATPPAILRLFDGRTSRGRLDRYVEEARSAAIAERDDPDGPNAVITCVQGRDRFLTASAWGSWASLESSAEVALDALARSRDRMRPQHGSPMHYELVY